MIKQTLLGLAVIVAPALAFAHSKSEATTPADGATVTEVPELSMRFDDPMRIISVTLTSSDGDIEILYTGLRPGEKLFEELLIGDSVSQTSHDRIMTAQEVSMEQADGT